MKIYKNGDIIKPGELYSITVNNIDNPYLGIYKLERDGKFTPIFPEPFYKTVEYWTIFTELTREKKEIILSYNNRITATLIEPDTNIIN